MNDKKKDLPIAAILTFKVSVDGLETFLGGVSL